MTWMVERLLASFDGHAGFEQEWAEEIHRRPDEYEAQEGESIPGDEVFAEARRRLGR